ncbi:MAG: phosphotransferase [Lachnospiraceae bacterium]|nr:phosphotransferase [Lachnospiraceae bacterium]
MNDNSITPEGVHIDQLEEIGKGSTATVYRLDEQHVLKVYDRPRYRNRPDFVEREAAVSHATALAGLPVPDSHGVGTVDGFLCAVYDLIKGDSLGDVILEDPSTLKAWAGRMAQLAKQIHSLDATDEVFTPVRMITKLYPYIEPNIDGESMQRFKVLAEAVSGGDKMVHTDFHFDNVLVDDGELRLIDAGGMSCGHPVYDFCQCTGGHISPKGPEQS